MKLILGIQLHIPATLLWLAGSFGPAAGVQAANASGGTMVRVGDYVIHTFTANGTFTNPNVSAIAAEVLLIGGGGGGAEGGGGGGGFLHLTNVSVPSGGHAVVVGSGGAAGVTGQNSSFRSQTAFGGGGGGLAGASGGGAPRDAGGPGGGASYGSQGYSGGGSNETGWSSAGGGGGAGGVGGDGYNVGGSENDEFFEPDGPGGNGGVGRQSSVTGSSVYYAGGGGGTNSSGYGAQPTGGLGGGGAGSKSYAVGGAGVNGLGGGGGAFAAGGSGVVIVRYHSPATQQTITFASIPNQTIGNPPITLSATASSGLPVTFSVSGPATLSGNTVTLTGALGTVSIVATQAGDLIYAPKTANQNFTVKYDQTVTFGALADRVYNDVPVQLSASASSGLAPVFSVVSGPAVVLGNTAVITGAGPVTVAANQPGNTTYNPAPAVARTFTVSKGNSVEATGGTITRVGDYLVHTYTGNGTFTVPGGFVTAEILAIGGGGAGQEGGGGGGGFKNVFGKIISAGSYPITVGGGGSASGLAGDSSFGNIVLAHGGGRGGQGGASGGGASTNSDSPGGAAIFGNEGYPGGASHESGMSAAGGGGGAGGPGEDGGNVGGYDEENQEWLGPDSKGGDGGVGRVSAITGANVYYGGGGGGTNNSGEGNLPAGGLGGGGAGSRSGEVGSAGINGLGGGGGTRSSGGSGVVIVRYYSPVLVAQTIAFAPLSDRTCGDPPFSLSATTTSGLPVAFAVTAGPAALSGNTLSFRIAGTVTVTATQPGGFGYAAAPSVARTFVVNKASQTVTFPAIANRTFGTPPFALGATASSGLPVSYTVSSGPAVVLGNTATLTGTGTVTLVASQAGSDTIAAATASQTFTITADTMAPAVPTGLVATQVSANSVRITWNAASDNVGVVAYEIHRDGVFVAAVGGTSATISGLVPQTLYGMVVKARDAAGNLSASGSLAVTTAAASTASDGDGVPDAVEDLLGTNKNSTGTSDTTDQLNFKVQSPSP